MLVVALSVFFSCVTVGSSASPAPVTFFDATGGSCQQAVSLASDNDSTVVFQGAAVVFSLAAGPAYTVTTARVQVDNSMSDTFGNRTVRAFVLAGNLTVPGTPFLAQSDLQTILSNSSVPCCRVSRLGGFAHVHLSSDDAPGWRSVHFSDQLRRQPQSGLLQQQPHHRPEHPVHQVSGGRDGDARRLVHYVFANFASRNDLRRSWWQPLAHPRTVSLPGLVVCIALRHSRWHSLRRRLSSSRLHRSARHIAFPLRKCQIERFTCS